jgi:hypothetical protein
MGQLASDIADWVGRDLQTTGSGVAGLDIVASFNVLSSFHPTLLLRLHTAFTHWAAGRNTHPQQPRACCLMS